MKIQFVNQKIGNMKIGVLILATLKYKKFVQPLLDDIKKYFLVDYEIEIHLFTDDCELEYIGDSRVKIIKDLIVAYKYPQITTYRYKIFTSKKYPNCDYLFYFDVDMSICDFIGNEILGNIVAVLHPGFSRKGGGSWCNDFNSTAYTFPEFELAYYAGGFQGGERERYYRAMESMKRDLEEDEKNNAIPEWHDEGTWNKYLSERRYFKVLDSSYCMVEEISLRKAWEIDHLQPKIIALAKDHSEIRS